MTRRQWSGEAARDERNPDVGDWIFHEEASALAYSGHLREARSEITSGGGFGPGGEPQARTAAMWEAGAAVREAFFGNPLEARQHATAALDFSKGRDVEYGAALAFALAGDRERSQALAKDLEKASEDTCVRFNYVPTLRAIFALSHGDSSSAIEVLQTATPYELSVGSASGFFGILYPVYVRGQAYLLAHRYAEAARGISDYSTTLASYSRTP